MAASETLSATLHNTLGGQTLVHAPSVLLLDEPAAGLDPEARRSLSDLIRRLSGEGMTILVSSHILAELEDYFTDMLMIRDGRVAGEGVVSAGTRSRTGLAGVRIRVAFAQSYDDLAARLSGLGFAVESAGGDDAVLVLDGADAEAQALAQLVGAGLMVRAFTPLRASLEEAYLQEARRPVAGGAA